MNRSVRIVLLAFLLLSTAIFGWRFKVNYDAFMAARERQRDPDALTNQNSGETPRATVAPVNYHLGFWGGGLVLSLVGAGLLIATEVSQFLGTRAMKALYNEDVVAGLGPDYEKAEEEWGKGNFLEAIRLLREYLQANPREQHVALRIAEIYEKDLLNPLAATLEYEEVLTQRLPPERWGWAAIHLCNLYTGKLNQLDKGVALLQRLVNEYPDTAAAEKARARLDQLQAEGLIAAPEPPAAEPDPGPSLPPGFRPKGT